MDMTLASCREFVSVLASDAPAPGGGGAAALVGAIGTALGNMVGSLTVGKKKYADVQDEIIALKAKCDELQTKLGAPRGFNITVRNIKVSAGAGFLVALTGEIMTMPGLPKVPAAERIDVDATGKISGLF